MATVNELIKGYGEGFPDIETLLGLEPDEAQLIAMSEPTPELCRYFKDVSFFCDVTSQKVVGMVRFKVLIERLIALNDELSRYSGVHHDKRVVHSLTDENKYALRQLARTPADVLRAERIERFTEHDTAAAGDYLKILIGTQMPHLEWMIEGVAFADTSEDTMGPVFGLIANKIVFGYFLPRLLDFIERLLDYVDELEKDGPLVIPALTHVQAAEPTTFGKKMSTWLYPLDFHIQRMMENDCFIPFSGKYGGAVGNTTTHLAAYPDIDWRDFGRRYIERLGLMYEEMTFQSSTYAIEASHFATLANMMTHIIKLTEDFVALASCPGQLFIKLKKPGTKGSSIMPNKSNAWNMEGALEMLRRSRAELFHYAQRLPAYPHEGNMGRSYLMRTLGGVFMPAFIALSRIQNEMVGDMKTRGYAPNLEKIVAFFREYPGMAGSSIQTCLKREGIEGDAYRQIEKIAINPDGTYADTEQFSRGLEQVMEANNLPSSACCELRDLLNPQRNIGDAHILAKRYSQTLRVRIGRYRAMLIPNEAPLI